MPDPRLDSQLARLRSQRSESLRISRGSTVVNVAGVVTRPSPRQQALSGVRIDARRVEFLVSAADLAPLGQPAEGDRIERLDHSDLPVYLVSTPSEQVNCWGYDDQAQTQIRIHAISS